MFLNIKGELTDISTPKVMVILNVTPDSFYDGGVNNNLDNSLRKCEEFLKQGADFIDIGGYSSKPYADEVSVSEELKRVLPVIESIQKHFPETPISIDTFRSVVAKESIAAGAAIINDISAGELDKNMFDTVAKLQVPYVLMHMQGTPQNMQNNPTYEHITKDVNLYFSEKLLELKRKGVNDLIIDPGFGFGKTIEDNYQLLQELQHLQIHNVPVVVGLSRKSMIYKVLKNTPKEALNGTSILNTIAVLNGANILRVHDVKEAKEVIELTKITLDFNKGTSKN